MQRNDATCVVHAGPQSEEYSQKLLTPRPQCWVCTALCAFSGVAGSDGPHGQEHEEDEIWQSEGEERWVKEGATHSKWQDCLKHSTVIIGGTCAPCRWGLGCFILIFIKKTWFSMQESSS